MGARGLVVIAMGLVLELMLPGRARAERVHSYAYVTATRGYCGAGTTCDHQRCEITALLPQKFLDHPPSGAPKELLAGATVVSDGLSDDEGQCEDVLHKWIRATFDTSDRKDADLSFPDPGFTFLRALGLVFVLVIGWMVWKQRRQAKRAKARPQQQSG